MSESTEDKTGGSDDAPPPTSPPPPPPRRKRHHWILWLIVAFVIAPISLLALWTTITLSYTYSTGERAGYVQKFSRKGWLCKTWEGELAMVNIPGAMQERWTFTVRNDSIAHLIDADMGDQVALSYAQHKGVPLGCFGETEYFVTGVRRVSH